MVSDHSGGVKPLGRRRPIWPKTFSFSARACARAATPRRWQTPSPTGRADANGGLFGLGKPNTAYAQYFTGESFLNPLTDPTKTVFLANVTFSPACRNNWHIHHAKSGGSQLLLCTDGLGWYQEAGKSAQALHPGDVVTIPAGVKHWHGAQKDCWFSHIAIECPGEETSKEWLEPVTDAEYALLDADCAQNP